MTPKERVRDGGESGQVDIWTGRKYEVVAGGMCNANGRAALVEILRAALDDVALDVGNKCAEVPDYYATVNSMNDSFDSTDPPWPVGVLDGTDKLSKHGVCCAMAAIIARGIRDLFVKDDYKRGCGHNFVAHCSFCGTGYLANAHSDSMTINRKDRSDRDRT